jgi:DNA (cytosine-5)-methyltransferase 1
VTFTQHFIDDRIHVACDHCHLTNDSLFHVVIRDWKRAHKCNPRRKPVVGPATRTSKDGMSRPKLLDLFSCAGGAGMGYHRAGFEVVGVDIDPQPNYPFEFHQGDALEFVKAHAHEFDAIHASPPCQAYSITKHTHANVHPMLIEPTRDALIATGKPYVIENVVGAPLVEPLMLCGSEFGLRAVDSDGEHLRLERHRLFESNVFLLGNGGCMHDQRVAVAGVYGGGNTDKTRARQVRHGGYTPAKSIAAVLIDAPWMTYHGLSQCIPPAYTEHIGRQLMEAL